MAVFIQRNMGLLVLAIWLILYGLSGMVALGLPAPLMGILALIAGILTSLDGNSCDHQATVAGPPVVS